MPVTVLAYSAGLASTVALWDLTRRGGSVRCLHLDHGQAAANREYEAAGQLVKRFQDRRPGQEVDLHRVTISGLAPQSDDRPPFARGGFLYTAAAAWFAEGVRAQQIAMAVTMSALVDDTYPHLSNLVHRFSAPGRFSVSGRSLYLPFIGMSRGEVVARGHRLGVPLRETWSCLGAGRLHCDHCGGCRARRFAFVNAGLTDPTCYATELTPAA